MNTINEDFTVEDILTALHKLASVGAARELGIDLPASEKITLQGLMSLAKLGADSDNERDFVRTCRTALYPQEMEWFLAGEELSTRNGNVARIIKRGEHTVIKRDDDDKVIEEIYDDYDYNQYQSMVGLLNNVATSADATVQYSENSTGIIVNCGGNVIGTGGEEMTLANIKACLNFIECMEE